MAISMALVATINLTATNKFFAITGCNRQDLARTSLQQRIGFCDHSHLFAVEQLD